MIDVLLQVGAVGLPVAREIIAALRDRYKRGREFWRGQAYALGAAPAGPLPAEWQRYRGARPELRGAPTNSILAVPGIEKTSPAFRARLLDLCSALGIPVDSLAVIMASESGFDAKALNPLPAGGLVQLTVGARLPGFGTKEAIRGILQMSAEEQLEKVVFPFYARSKRAKGADPGFLYMLNFLPGEAGKPEDHQLGVKGEAGPDGKPTFRARVYELNPGFDPEKRGYLTVGDVYNKAAAMAGRARGRRIAVDGTILEPSGGAASPSRGAEPSPKASAPSVGPSSSAPASPGASPALAAPATPAAPVAAPAPAKAKTGKDERPIAWDAPAGGLLLRAVERADHIPPRWVPVTVGDLVLEVTADALSAPVAYLDEHGKEAYADLRLPASYSDQVKIARHFYAVSPTAAWWDAIFRAARLKVVPEPLPAGPLMSTVGYSVRHHRNLAKYNPAPGTLIRDVGKGWILSRRLGESSAINYGWIQPNGQPIQGEGARHNDAYADYSQTVVLVRRFAHDTKGAGVDLLEYLREQGIAKRWLDGYA